MAEAFYKAKLHRVRADHEHDRDRRCRALGGGGQGHAAGRRDDCNLLFYEFGGECRKAVELIISRAIVDDYLLVFHEARISQSLDKSFGDSAPYSRPCGEPANDRRLALRVRSKRPTDR